MVAPGINGKMNEFCAAFGLLQLEGLNEAIGMRKLIDARYRARLASVRGIECVGDAGERVANYSYFPILVKPDYPMSRDALCGILRSKGIQARRYFYPLITDFPMYRGLPSAATANLPVATRAAQQVICLPIYSALDISISDSIVDIIAG